MTAPALRDPRLLTDAELQAEVDALLQADNAGRIAAGHRQWATPGAMARHLEPAAEMQTPAQDLLDRELVALTDGDTRRLIFTMPPQEGKSQKVSRRWVLWLLHADPTLRIAIVSYSHRLARRWGKAVRRDITQHPELGLKLRADSRAADEWETEQGGGVICTSVMGSLTGRPVDVLIIDDPIKDRAAAESSTIRRNAWDWWENVGRTRLSARGRVCLVLTRWHEDDIAGRLLAREPKSWRYVRVPAVAGSRIETKHPDGSVTVDWVSHGEDPLGRQPGEEMLSVQKREPGYFRQQADEMSAYAFGSIYQGAPTAAEGNLFKRTDWRYWTTEGTDHGHGVVLALGELERVRLSECWRFGTVDLAASKRTSADWTVISAWAFTQSGHLILLDRYRGRMGEDDHIDAARPLVQRWGLDTVFLEKSFQSSTLARDLGSAGIPLSPLDAEGDKVTRALPYTHRVHAHRVWLPAGQGWTTQWVDEHAEFPNATHDDQVDTGSYASRVVSTQFAPFRVSSGRQPGMPAVPTPERVPGVAEGLDLERQQW